MPPQPLGVLPRPSGAASRRGNVILDPGPGGGLIPVVQAQPMNGGQQPANVQGPNPVLAVQPFVPVQPGVPPRPLGPRNQRGNVILVPGPGGTLIPVVPAQPANRGRYNHVITEAMLY